MVKKSMTILLLSAALLVGCATTTTFTLAGGDTIRAKNVLQETASTYIIEEADTGRRTVIPKSAVVAVNGKAK